jgi:hypothetical protein
MTRHESGSPQADDRNSAFDPSGCPGASEIGSMHFVEHGRLPGSHPPATPACAGRLPYWGGIRTGVPRVADADLGTDAVHAVGDDVVVFWITSASGPS